MNGATQMHTVVPKNRRPSRPSPRSLRGIDGVVMLTTDGTPAAGNFPDNVWLVMGRSEDKIEDFFGPAPDVIAAELEQAPGVYCVGVDKEGRLRISHRGTYPVYISEILRMQRLGE